MRGGVAGQDPDVHADTVAGETHEPFHFSDLEMGSTRRGIDVHAYPGSNDATGAIDEITIKRRMMARIFFQDPHAAAGGRMAQLPRRYR